MQQNQSRNPQLYSQSFNIRNNLPESEPLSEYSEMQEVTPRAKPGQTTSRTNRVYQTPSYGSSFQQMIPKSTSICQVGRPSHGATIRHMTPQASKVHQVQSSSPGSPYRQMTPQAGKVYQIKRSSPGSPYRQMTPQAGKLYQVKRYSSGTHYQMMPSQVTAMYQIEMPNPEVQFQTKTPQLPRMYHDENINPDFSFIAGQHPNQNFPAHYNNDPQFVMQPSVVGLPKQGTISTSSAASPKASGTVPKNSSPQDEVDLTENTRFFVGSIEQVVRWHKIAKKAHLSAMYEVSAILEKMYFNLPVGMYNMILRDEHKKYSPLQVTYYTIDRKIPKVTVGKLITCVGRMVGSNKLQAFDMWPTTANSLIGFQRTSYLCQRTLQEIELKTNEAK